MLPWLPEFSWRLDSLRSMSWNSLRIASETVSKTSELPVIVLIDNFWSSFSDAQSRSCSVNKGSDTCMPASRLRSRVYQRFLLTV